MNNYRLTENNIDDLFNLIDIQQYPLTEELARQICTGNDPVDICTQVYGMFNENNELVSIMTASYFIAFPNKNDGYKVVHISGAFTREDMRRKGYATKLLYAIEQDAKNYFNANYLCCDSTVNNLYKNNGFKNQSNNESRLWKPLN